MGSNGRMAIVVLMLALLVVLLPTIFRATEPATSSLRSMIVAFKFNPVLAQGVVRWISPPNYTSGIQAGTEATVEARVILVDGNGKAVAGTPEWIASDPDMVVITPVSLGRSDHVQIRVKHAGESKVTVKSEKTTKELTVTAISVIANAMQIRVSQSDGSPSRLNSVRLTSTGDTKWKSQDRSA